MTSAPLLLMKNWNFAMSGFLDKHPFATHKLNLIKLHFVYKRATSCGSIDGCATRVTSLCSVNVSLISLDMTDNTMRGPGDIS